MAVAASTPGLAQDRPVRSPRARAQAWRLLFNNPRQLGLMVGRVGLLHTPRYLGERRRSIRGLRARRAAVAV